MIVTEYYATRKDGVVLNKAYSTEGKYIVDEGKEYTDYLNPDSAKRLTGCKLEPALADAKPGDKFQFVRTGYFCLDTKNPGVFNRTVTLKDSYKPAK